MYAPFTNGSLSNKYSMISVAGVIGYPAYILQPAAKAPSPAAWLPINHIFL